MPIVPAKCTECGGILHVDKEKDAAVCPHCNTPFIIDKAVNNYFGTAGQHDFEISAGELIKYNGAAADVIIPDIVTHIGEGAFKNRVGLRSVIIPKSVVSIGNYAFSGCTSLTNIAIPSSAVFIGDYVFADCTNLRSAEIPYNITSFTSSSFTGCSKLTAINGKPKNEYYAFSPLENERNRDIINTRSFTKIYFIMTILFLPAGLILDHGMIIFSGILFAIGWILGIRKIRRYEKENR